jgi:tricorn protease
MKPWPSLIIVVSLAWSAAASAQLVGGETRFFHDPTICGDHIVMVHGGDLWSVPLAGGAARPVVARPGARSNPACAPDARSVAFSEESGGNIDVYVVATRGGEPRRLTWHPSEDRVLGWSPDGSRILFTSDAQSEHFRPRLMAVAARGGHPELFPMQKAFHGTFSPDARRVAYTPIRDAFTLWKRYRGGQTTPIWLVDLQTYEHVEIPHQNASDTYPVWLGDSIYFLSDRKDVMSVFRYDVRRATVEPVVDNGDTDIDSLSGGPGRLVFASAGYIYVYELTTKRSRRVDIRVDHGAADTAAGQKTVSELVRSVALAPDGRRAAVEARGELFVVEALAHTAVNVSRTSGAAERNPVWSPDGRSIAYFSDADGDYALYTREPADGATATKVPMNRPGVFYQPVWSPDGRKVAYVDKHRTLWWVDLDTKRHTAMTAVVGTNEPYVWTPDSRGVVFANEKPTYMRELAVYSLESGTVRPLTHPIGDACRPAFSHDGRYLFFLGSTNSGQVKSWGDLSVVPLEPRVTWSIFAVILHAGDASPFSLPLDSATPAMSGRDRDDRPIQWEGAERRIVRVPLPAARYTDVQAAADGSLFVRELPSETTFAGVPKLRRVDWRTRTAVDVLDNVDEFSISRDGGTVLYRTGSTWGVVPVGGTPTPTSGALDFSTLQATVSPRDEWRQMFAEVWRNFRDFFYDDAMHGIDWQAMRVRYEPWVENVSHRSDLDYVFRQLAGEIVNSHIAIRPAQHATPESVTVGLLGADFAVSDGRYRIARIVPSTSWDDETSPLAVPGVDVTAGDYLLEVNGQDLRPPTSVYAPFVGMAGKPVTLRVGPAPTTAGSRMVTVVPLESERQLRRREWIERNRLRVEQWSSGRIAYVYQPDTTSSSVEEFNRLFFPQSDRAALIIDERFNAGGGDPDYQLDIMNRQQVHWYATRDQAPVKSPFSIVAGPKVMLINAESSSGGDVYPYQFTIRKLGTTVGTRTWGGANGGGAGVPLIDGGVVRVPDLGTYAPDGSYILENVGFKPDVEVQIFPKDDVEGRDPQLEKAVAILLAELQKHPPAGTPRLSKVNRARSRSRRTSPSRAACGANRLSERQLLHRGGDSLKLLNRSHCGRVRM